MSIVINEELFKVKSLLVTPELKKIIEEKKTEISPPLFLVEGLLDIPSPSLLEQGGFIRSRSNQYKVKRSDVRISRKIIQEYNLRKGDEVVCIARRKDRMSRTVNKVIGLNGFIYKEIPNRPNFDEFTAVYPKERYNLDYIRTDYSMRIINMFAPIGKGQRGLIVAQPKTGKTTLLRHLSKAIKHNHPETEVIILLIDERPEEVSEIQITSEGQAMILSSTFDENPKNHIHLAELGFELSKRMVESGKDVVILLDSITRLARSYNICTHSRGRTLTGGVDSEALKIPRRLFSLARNLKDGGSLTVIATALVNTGSRMDDVIFEEFKGTGNMEIVLDRDLADRRLFPAIDILRSGTRQDNLFVPDFEVERVTLIRQLIRHMNNYDAIMFLLERIKMSPNNRRFLEMMNQ